MGGNVAFDAWVPNHRAYAAVQWSKPLNSFAALSDGDEYIGCYAGMQRTLLL
jgi:hypothetical protein